VYYQRRQDQITFGNVAGVLSRPGSLRRADGTYVGSRGIFEAARRTRPHTVLQNQHISVLARIELLRTVSSISVVFWSASSIASALGRSAVEYYRVQLDNVSVFCGGSMNVDISTCLYDDELDMSMRAMISSEETLSSSRRGLQFAKLEMKRPA
jgi:hypothetical protein